MSNKINWELIAKYLSGECSSGENSEVEKWLADSEENGKLLESMKKVWDTPDEKFDASDVKAIWKNVAGRIGIAESAAAPVIDLRSKKKKYPEFSALYDTPALRYAAAVVILASAALLYFLISGLPWADKWNSIIVKSGEIQSILLDDGSRITADAGSSVMYPEDYGEESRDIKLTGEAYFEVSHNPDLPFRVYSGKGIVEVLGTKFNVRNWEESESMTVAVIEGRVSFFSSGMQNSLVLEKGDAGELSENGKLSLTERIDTTRILSWLAGKIYFENTPLSEILAQLERWYNIKINLTDQSVETEKLSVLINKKSLMDNIDLLSRLTASSYSIEGKKVTLTPSK